MQVARQPRQGRGFSLIELMVALAIASILLGLAVPSLRGLLGESRISAVTNDFVYALQLSRSEAIKRAAPVVMCASSNPLSAPPACSASAYQSGWVVFADNNADATLDAGDTIVLQAGGGGAGVNFTPSAAIATRVRFDATGSSVSDGGAPLPGNVAIALVDGDQRRVDVKASGRIVSSTP